MKNYFIFILLLNINLNVLQAQEKQDSIQCFFSKDGNLIFYQFYNDDYTYCLESYTDTNLYKLYLKKNSKLYHKEYVDGIIKFSDTLDFEVFIVENNFSENYISIDSSEFDVSITELDSNCEYKLYDEYTIKTKAFEIIIMYNEKYIIKEIINATELDFKATYLKIKTSTFIKHKDFNNFFFCGEIIFEVDDLEARETLGIVRRLKKIWKEK